LGCLTILLFIRPTPILMNSFFFSDSFICLAERGGISIYAENSAESHVSHIPEFQITNVMPCKFGLIVVPSKLKKDPSTNSKSIFILTHPIKQVSKIWIKLRPGSGKDRFVFIYTEN